MALWSSWRYLCRQVLEQSLGSSRNRCIMQSRDTLITHRPTPFSLYCDFRWNLVAPEVTEVTWGQGLCNPWVLHFHSWIILHSIDTDLVSIIDITGYFVLTHESYNPEEVFLFHFFVRFSHPAVVSCKVNQRSEPLLPRTQTQRRSAPLITESSSA